MFKPPTVKQAEDYITLNNYKVDAELWWDYYESVGWRVGKNKMVNWQAAVRTWHRKNLKQGEAVWNKKKIAAVDGGKFYPEVRVATGASRITAEETDKYLSSIMGGE